MRNSKTNFVQSDLEGGVFSRKWVFVGIKSVFEMREAYPNVDFGELLLVDLPFTAWDLKPKGGG